MKKIIALVLVSVLTLSAFTMGVKDSGEDTSLEDVKAKGEFIMGLDDSFPPLGFRDEANNIVGYDIDLAKEVAKRMGVEFVAQPIDWAAKEQELDTKKIDCIWNGFTMTAERKEMLNFSEAYLNNAQIIVVRKDSGITDKSQLAGKSVGLQAGSSASEALDSVPEFKDSLKNVVEFKDNVMAFMDLDSKGIDAVIVDMVVAGYAISQDYDQFVMLEESLTTEEYGIGFRKNDNSLRNEVQKILEEMAADGTVAAISTKWFSTDISVIGK